MRPESILDPALVARIERGVDAFEPELTALAQSLVACRTDTLGRDPAQGSSVMITAITDSGGFFIFLGLATLLL